MLVDLHAHYPMQVIPKEHRGTHNQMQRWHQARGRAQLIKTISRFKNFQGDDNTPSVTFEGMRKGDVGIILSVLYLPFDEIDADYGAPPAGDSLGHITDQIEAVEASLPRDPGAPRVIVVKNLDGLEDALGGEGLGLVHCIEGGFVLGPDEQGIDEAVATLARHGVAYITLAHLFWRRVATNAPALPFMPDWFYRRLFSQPKEGLSVLGRRAVEAMIGKRMLVDVSHMSDASFDETLSMIEAHPGTPVLATHSAFRFGYARGGLEYNLDPAQVRRIRDVDGVIGLIMCTHYVSHGLYPPEETSHSLDLLYAHIDAIAELCDWSHDHIAIGSDLDGFIKPALPGLERLEYMGALQDGLVRRYGREIADKISSGNALRMLRYRFGG
jgi:microsomal dipeptidase-like Zn-dependent dipeptidase